MKTKFALIALLTLALTSVSCETVKTLGKFGFEVDVASGAVEAQAAGVKVGVNVSELLNGDEEK